MALPSSLGRSLRLSILLCACGLAAVLFVALDHETYLQQGRDRWSASSFIPSVSSASSCPSTCPADPFSMPGMLRLSNKPEKDYNDTIWMPFPPVLEDGDSDAFRAGGSLQDASAAAGAPTPQGVANLAERQWTKELAEAGLRIQAQDAAGVEGAQVGSVLRVDMGQDWEWARGKTVLLVGSSHDRNNVRQFCAVVNGEYDNWGGHIGGVCSIAHLDLKVVHWFLTGMVDDDTHDEFMPRERRPITFERRIPEIVLPAMHEAGLVDLRPDLVIMASLFWDDGLLRLFAHERFRPKELRYFPGLSYSESAWHRSRLHALVGYMREQFGDGVPMMFRTRHLRTHAGHWALLATEQLDQGVRAVGKALGVRDFKWGDLMVGYNLYYDKDQHFAIGPNTYIFGDMMLAYLRRATDARCWRCDWTSQNQ